LYGVQILFIHTGVLIQLVDGAGQNTAGTGIHTSHLVGQLIIMVDGTTMTITDGSGYLIMFGDQHGLNGDTMMIISVGHLYHHMLSFELVLVSISQLTGDLITHTGTLLHTDIFIITD